MMQKISLLALALALLATPLAAQTPPPTPGAAQAPAAIDPAQLAPRQEGPDMVMGLATAPVTIIEYASLTCPHCAAFHTDTLPKLKSEYIDKGLVRFVYRDYPLDGAALNASMIARCAGPARYFTFLDVMFKQQSTWARGNTVPELTNNLKRLVRLGNMPPDEFDACLAKKEIETAVLAQRMAGDQEFRITGTPTIIVNGSKHQGAPTFEALDQVLKPLVRRS